ncbi:hypothetical protein M885DRAFT_522951 [Pelagophyceae sp. CCMP2097]|nr:hypothetical protein M885DRAFT_522951 [Pelagophyceae sp. CCMP2097]
MDAPMEVVPVVAEPWYYLSFSACSCDVDSTEAAGDVVLPVIAVDDEGKEEPMDDEAAEEAAAEAAFEAPAVEATAPVVAAAVVEPVVEPVAEVKPPSPVKKPVVEKVVPVVVPKISRAESLAEVPIDVAAVKALLVKGVSVKKHGSDGKIRPRVLYLNAAGTKFGWKQPESSFLPLSGISEVRRATEKDPSSKPDSKRPKGMAGTPTLRKTADGPAVALRAFSFIGQGRTYDFECADSAECQLLSGAFKAMISKK